MKFPETTQISKERHVYIMGKSIKLLGKFSFTPVCQICAMVGICQPTGFFQLHMARLAGAFANFLFFLIVLDR